MTQIEQVPFIPKLEYSDYAWKELRMHAGAIAAVNIQSEGIWVVSAEEPIMVCGVIRESMISKPRFWFLLCRAFTERKINFHLRALKSCSQVLSEEYPGLETYVEDGWKTGERFANFCGFRKTERVVMFDDKAFKVWEK